MRWLKGYVAGAIEAEELAVSAGSPSDAESAAWAWTRLAGYRFQSGEISKAESACKAATQFMKDYPPALLQEGRILLHTRKVADAAAIIRRAAERNPLPEYQWALADALRAAKRTNEAIGVEAQLTRTGAADDPRTFALFLATHGHQTNLVLRLAERELRERADVFTYDALAWALFNSGRSEEAWNSMKLALAEGTRDARMFLHAGVIAAQLRRDDAAHWLAKAQEFERLLLPSERGRLDNAWQVLNQKRGQPGLSYPGIRRRSMTTLKGLRPAANEQRNEAATPVGVVKHWQLQLVPKQPFCPTLSPTLSSTLSKMPENHCIRLSVRLSVR